MKCPFCDQTDDKVIDSREVQDGRVVRRRRACLPCGRRFTTYEKIEEIPYMVVKRDERRIPYDRARLIGGLLKACHKRPIKRSQLEEIVNEIEQHLADSPDKEITSTQLGDIVIARLKELDQVAYVRFASVYRQFGDVSEFMDELKALIEPKK